MSDYTIIKKKEVSGELVSRMMISNRLDNCSMSDIKEIWYKPAYYISLDTLFEKRNLIKDSRPYNKEEIPRQIFFKESDIDVWSFGIKPSDGFTNSSKRFVVTGSQTLSGCTVCKSDNYNICRLCLGKGKIECNSCEGKGYNSCHKCSGRGNNPCRL
jgi:hypothetical protein